MAGLSLSSLDSGRRPPLHNAGKIFRWVLHAGVCSREEAPFIPVSASATLIIGARIRGELQLRELGSYRLEGIDSGALLDLRLFPNDGSRASRAIGKWADSEMDLELSITDASGELQSRGKLQLEAYAEWRATSALKAGRDLKDPSLRSWHKPGYDDSRWELVELPDDNSFGKKHPYERLYRSRFIRADPKEAVKVTVSPDHPSTETSQETEAVNLVFSSDDGIWIYVNGHLLGHWGGWGKRSVAPAHSKMSFVFR